MALAIASSAAAEDLRQIQKQLEDNIVDKLTFGRTATDDTELRPIRKKFKRAFAFTPLFIVNERVFFAGGGAFSFAYYPFDEDTRFTQNEFDVVVGVEGHFRARTFNSVYFPGNKWFLEASGHIRLYPEEFWGVGARAPTYIQYYDERGAGINVQLQRALERNAAWTVGLGYRYRFHKVLADGVYDYWQQILAFEQPSILDGAGVLGGSGTSQDSHFSLISRFDTRDTRFTTRDGHYAQLTYGFSNQGVGATSNYQSFDADLRAFRTYGIHTIAGQVLLGHQWGDVPFYELNSLGGSNILRGLYRGKYRNKSLAVLQAEYRVPLYWVFGGAAFASAGTVHDFDRRWDSQDFQYGGGLGVRARFDERVNLNLRVDIAYYAREELGFVVELSEAF